MKQILIAMALTIGYCGANAQTTQLNVCGEKHGKVCRTSADKKTTACYKTKFAENYKVCKNNFGYFICCEVPDATNSTNPQMAMKMKSKANSYATVEEEQYTYTQDNDQQADVRVPQSQSYVVTSSNTYAGYYPKKTGEIKICYLGDNVARNNRAPYKGCPSPQYDGPAANRRRNVNVNQPVNLAPITGRAQQ